MKKCFFSSNITTPMSFQNTTNTSIHMYKSSLSLRINNTESHKLLSFRSSTLLMASPKLKSLSSSTMLIWKTTSTKRSRVWMSKSKPTSFQLSKMFKRNSSPFSTTLSKMEQSWSNNSENRLNQDRKLCSSFFLGKCSRWKLGRCVRTRNRWHASSNRQVQCPCSRWDTQGTC